MSRVELHHGAATDVGLVREVNEDAYLAAPPVFVVADGMGGHEGGDVASRDRGRGVRAGSPTRATTRAAAPRPSRRRCGPARSRIAEYGAEQRAARRRGFQAGTTAVVALLVEDDEGPQWLLANLGDSRIYRFADGRLEQVSVDHSLVQELVDAGADHRREAAVHPERHVVTRALGGPTAPSADYFLLPLAAAERLLLCSDGITGMIDDARIAAILAGAADPRDAADALVAAAVEAGGRDNATAVVVDVVGLVTEDADDSERQRVSLEQKLGALP